MNHWQNFYHDATAEKLDDFTIEDGLLAKSSFDEVNRFYDMLHFLVVQATRLGWLIERTECPPNPGSYYKWRFRLPETRT